MTFSVLVNTYSSLSGSQELAFGLRRLRQVCAASAGFAGWLTFDARDNLVAAFRLVQSTPADKILVILNPALVTTASLVACMERVLLRSPERVVVAADPRSARAPWQIDYASRAGLERYVTRRRELPECAQAEPHAPWVFMAQKQVLTQLLESLQDNAWQDLAHAVANNALVAQHAFVHSFADYQSSDRKDIMDLVPDPAQRLMDVGGGEGWFLSAFQAARNGIGLLVEPSAASAALAQSRGLKVANTRFETVTPESHGLFDCISFLDVLEHLEEPLAALQHAKTLLRPHGAVLLSVPNVGHWSVVEDLLAGRFDYLPLGILCCTHLRFFTEMSLREMLADAGLRVVTWRNQPSPMPERLKASLHAALAGGMALNLTSLETDSFHVLAEMD